MRRKIHRLIADILIILLSIIFAFYISETGLVDKIMGWFDGLEYLGVFIAGMFFTSAFTTPPAIVILGNFAEKIPVASVAIIGGFGALLGDYIIFKFIKNRVAEDVSFIMSYQKGKRFFSIFKTRLFRHLTPFIGAIIIASPFPDEIGIAMLGLSKIKDKSFIIISFIFNIIGISIIGLLDRSV